MTCAQCGTTAPLTLCAPYGSLCAPCAYRQAERDSYGYGLAPSTFGFESETE